MTTEEKRQDLFNFEFTRDELIDLGFEETDIDRAMVL